MNEFGATIRLGFVVDDLKRVRSDKLKFYELHDQVSAAVNVTLPLTVTEPGRTSLFVGLGFLSGAKIPT